MTAPRTLRTTLGPNVDASVNVIVVISGQPVQYFVDDRLDVEPAISCQVDAQAVDNTNSGMACDQFSWRISMEQDREGRIRARAYEIWEHEGPQDGSHLAHWEQAENELREEAADEPQQVGNGAATPPAASSGSGEQPSSSAPFAEPAADGGSLGTGSARPIDVATKFVSPQPGT